MVKREVFGCEGKGRRLGFLERRQSLFIHIFIKENFTVSFLIF
jgi:hypothetical protein